MSIDERNPPVNEEMSPEADGTAPSAGTGPAAEDQDQRLVTGLAVAAAGISIMGFVSLFRLRVRWDQSRARAFRRFFGVQASSLTGIALGYRSLNQLRRASGDKRGVPFAVLAIVLGASNVARAIFWLRQDRPDL